MSEKLNPIHPAPIMRFMIEFTTWTWLLVISLTYFGFDLIILEENLIGEPWIYLVLLIASLVLLSQFNFPGDKKPHGKLVSGRIRISIEIFSASLGVLSAWFLFGLIGIIIQVILTLSVFYLDRDRWRWMLGRLVAPPDYVVALGYIR
jgi:hypothetical protein